MLKRNKHLPFLLLVAMALCLPRAYSQGKYHNIKLPAAINGVNEEFSGIATFGGRVYLLPQYGAHKPTLLNGTFNIYSLNADSINRVINGTDTALLHYRTISVLNLQKLPAAVKKYYQGFETITIVKGTVYLAIETNDTSRQCYVLKGKLDTVKNHIIIDPYTYVALKKPVAIKNAGFESVAYLPPENKLLAMYEYNAQANGGTGYLIDLSLKKTPVKVKTPYLLFRITDIDARLDGRIYGINYYWNGDSSTYVYNKHITNPDARVKQQVPDLRDSLTSNPKYLKNGYSTYARIVTLKNYKAQQWQQVATFDGFKKNWEGITLFKNGALIITDANINKHQVTELAYVGF